VWLATDAPEIGLVDELGGIDSAIADEAQSAGIDDYQVEYYGQELSPEEIILKELLENFDVSLGEPRVLSALDGISKRYETLIDIREPKAFFTCEDCWVALK
jgi:protease-4